MGMSLEITEDLIARQSPEAQVIIRLLLVQVAELKAEVAALRAELATLKKTPQNSSLPPSTQHPHARPAGGKPRSIKNRGGQPGHPRHERALIPVEDCTAVVTLRPSACRRCGTGLTGHDPQPWRHQVWELPEIKPLVTEYQQHRLACPGCGETTCASLPPGVPRGQSGPRLIAFTALLMAYFRQSKRRTALFVTSILNIPCGPSLTVKHQHIATQALRPGYDDLARALPQQPHLNGDGPRGHPPDEGREDESLAVDVRGPDLHSLRPAGQSGRHGPHRIAGRDVRRGDDLRPGEDVLAMRPVAVVLGASEAGPSII